MGPYVRRMIPEPGDPARTVPVPETFHEQTDDELTEAEIKQMEDDDQAIQNNNQSSSLIPRNNQIAQPDTNTSQDIKMKMVDDNSMKIPSSSEGEYDILGSMRMRQYICHTDHNLWDVIVNRDLEEEPVPTGETSAPPAPKTAKQLAAKRNQERVKSILLLAIPDEYLLKFHNVADAKSL
ncbi:hypothetical protein Tco_0972242 [Tanacetum coccineum]